MTRDNDNRPEDSDDDLNEFARDPFKRTREQQGLDGFEEDEEPADDLEEGLREDYDDDYDDDPYDEPERDTAYPPAYREEDDDEDDYYDDQQPLLRETRPEQDALDEDEEDEDEDEDEYFDDEPDESPGNDSRWNAARLADSDAFNWLEDAPYSNGQENMENNYTQRLPMGLLVVAVIAVALLIAGGYGVMQQRTQAKEEIRRLEGLLATAASSEDIENARAEAEALRAENDDLEDRVYDLAIENRKLLDLVAGLEAQVEALNTGTQAPANPAPAAPAPRPAPAPAPVEKPPEPAKPVATAAPGTWFVNFGSYGQLSAAQSWQAKLQPASGDVITAPGERDGKTFYRVRVVNLPDKAAAQDVARELEKQYNLPRLWVGQE